MANQIIIDIGAVANDGTGDPLRTAFGYVNDNFSNVWATGVANANIGFSGNKILTVNTNGNLVLAPNGTGKVVANVDIVPNMANVRNLGAINNRWSTVYSQYLNVTNDVDFTGDVTIGGNLTVEGDTIQIGNITTDTKTIQLANTANTANAATGSGVTVGANDNIATMLYNSTSNTWVMNIGLDTPNIVVNNITSDDSTFVTVQDGLNVDGEIESAGNVTAPYFFGNASQMTGITSYSNTNATSLLASFGSNTISTTGNITAGYFIGNGSQLTGVTSYANANAVAYGQTGWAGNIIPSGNAVYSLGNATNQWNDLYVSNATIYMNNVPVSLTAGNVLTVNGADVVTTDGNGNIDVNNIVSDSNIAIDTSAEQVTISVNLSDWVFDETGVLTAPGEIETVGNISAGYFLGNGSQLTGITSISDGNSSVAFSGLDGNAVITTNGGGGGQWIFDTDGVLTLPANIDLTPNDGFLSINTLYGGAIEMNDGAGNTGAIGIESDSSGYININNGGGDQLWTFTPDGTFTAPGNITTTGNISVGNILAQNIRTIEGTVHVGQGAGLTNQGTYAIAMGRFAGSQDQGGAGLAIGQLAGQISQGISAVALGLYAAANTQSANAVAVGTYAGQITQGTSAIAIGREAGNSSQGALAVAIGTWAGNASQGGYSVAIGPSAGSNTQGQNSVAIGVSAAREAQGSAAIAIGQGSGTISQGSQGIAIGDQAGQQSQAANAIAIGTYAGYESAGVSSISIGTGAGYYIANNSIVINATGANLDGNTANTFTVAPVRNDVSNIGQVMFYNTTSKEVTYGNTISVAGNITASATVSGQTLVSTQSAANEGGEITLALPSSGSTLSGNIIIDSYQDWVRFFEGGGTSRGLYVDIPNVSTSGQYAIGYRDVPQIALSGNVTANSITAGKHFYSTTAGNLQVTIPDNANVAFPTGATITVVVNAAGNVIIAQGTGVSLYMAGSSTTGNRAVGAYGLASIMKVATDTWVISGTGVY